MNTYCIIAHQFELDKVESLIMSVREYDEKAHFSILIVGKRPKNKFSFHQNNCSYYFYDKTYFSSRSTEFYRNYKFRERFRKAMIPEFLKMMLKIGVEKIIYLDRNTQCYSPLTHEWDLLDTYHILLNPNGWSKDPLKNEASFINNFTNGFYSADFLGLTKGAIPALEWWSDMALCRFDKKRKDGLYDFLNYLNLFPLLFENTCVLKDTGLGISYLNIEERIKLFTSSEQIKCIHFSEELERYINLSGDSVLKKYLMDSKTRTAEVEIPVFHC